MYKRGSVGAKLHDIVENKKIQLSDERLNRLTEIVEKVVHEEQSTFFNFIATKAIGRTYKPRLPGFENVSWQHLSKKYRAKKGNNKKWYSGFKKPEGRVSLYDFLMSSSPDSYYPKSKIKVSPWGQNSKKYKISKKIVISPGIVGRKRKKFNVLDNPLNENKTQEDKVFAKNKHTGLSNEQMRPLFEPMGEYYVRHKIPRAINRAIHKEFGRNRYNFS